MFDQAYRIVCKHNNDIDYGNLASLIYNLSALGETVKARLCIHILQRQQHYKLGSKDLIAIGKYYDKIGNKDSAAIYYKKVMADQSDFAYAYDASKFLFDLYEGQGNNEEAIKYAKSYVNISDSLDLGKRQEMAATVNNQYQYHLDRNKEMEAEEGGRIPQLGHGPCLVRNRDGLALHHIPREEKKQPTEDARRHVEAVGIRQKRQAAPTGGNRQEE